MTCLLGKLEYARPLYRCRSERRSLCPVDDSLGLLPGSMTRPAGKLAACMVSQCTPRQSGRIFDRSGGMAPSVSSMQRLMGDLHWAWQGIEEDALDDIRAGQEIPAGAVSVSVSLDGAMVLLRPGEGPCVDGPERNWLEAACRVPDYSVMNRAFFPISPSVLFLFDRVHSGTALLSQAGIFK